MKKVTVLVFMTVVFLFSVLSAEAGLKNFFKSKFGGCYKKSEVVQDKCLGKVKKKLKKDLKKLKKGMPLKSEIDAVVEKSVKANQACGEESKAFLLKCRVKKLKLKKGKNPEDMKKELDDLKEMQVVCLGDKFTYCMDKAVKTLGVKKNSLNMEQLDQLGEEAEECQEELKKICDYDKAELKIFEKYVSTEK